MCCRTEIGVNCSVWLRFCVLGASESPRAAGHADVAGAGPAASVASPKLSQKLGRGERDSRLDTQGPSWPAKPRLGGDFKVCALVCFASLRLLRVYEFQLGGLGPALRQPVSAEPTVAASLRARRLCHAGGVQARAPAGSVEGKKRSVCARDACGFCIRVGRKE